MKNGKIDILYTKKLVLKTCCNAFSPVKNFFDSTQIENSCQSCILYMLLRPHIIMYVSELLTHIKYNLVAITIPNWKVISLKVGLIRSYPLTELA